MKKISKKRKENKKSKTVISYRVKCDKTANGLSHYVPNEKKSLV